MTEAHDGMRPVVESRVALDWLSSYGRERQIEASIDSMGSRVREIVPQCFALSLGLIKDGLTFTFVSESREIAVLDAIQYLDGGPCVAAAHTGEVTESGVQGACDESAWQLFASSRGAVGVASTLSLPVLRGEAVVCGINLYASTPDAFDHHHEELADACGAWAEGVITNADLSFTSRLRAAAAPTRLRDDAFFAAATGFVAERQGIGPDAAAEKIRDAASRAGVNPTDVARFILNAHPDVGV